MTVSFRFVLLSLRDFALQRNLRRFGNERAEDLRLDILFFAHRQVADLAAIALQPQLKIEELVVCWINTARN